MENSELDLAYMSIKTLKAQVLLLEKENLSLRQSLQRLKDECHGRNTVDERLAYERDEEDVMCGIGGGPGY